VRLHEDRHTLGCQCYLRQYQLPLVVVQTQAQGSAATVTKALLHGFLQTPVVIDRATKAAGVPKTGDKKWSEILPAYYVFQTKV